MSKLKGYIPSYEECKLVNDMIKRIQKLTKSKYVSGLEVQNYIRTCMYWKPYYDWDKNKENN